MSDGATEPNAPRNGKAKAAGSSWKNYDDGEVFVEEMSLIWLIWIY
jgi:hypothetical protein